MPTGSGSRGGRGGGSGSTNAALNSDEDLMNRRRILWHTWKMKKRPKQMIDYSKSPSPPVKKY